MQHLNAKRKPLHHEVVYIETERDDIGIELAMQYNDGYNENVFSFVNNINTHEGGTHLTGFKSALTRVINAVRRRRRDFLKKDKDSRSRATTCAKGSPPCSRSRCASRSSKGRPRRSSATPKSKAR